MTSILVHMGQGMYVSIERKGGGVCKCAHMHVSSNCDMIAFKSVIL